MKTKGLFQRLIGTSCLGVLQLIVWNMNPARAADNGLALTPPMGWNSWSKFVFSVNENIVKEMTDAMVTNGLREAGYQFINLDDSWQASRDTNGVIVADPTRFPSGIKPLADYVHAKGLKLGVYSDRGTRIAAAIPAPRATKFWMPIPTLNGGLIT